MEGKAKAERDSLTQAEEEDTSAYCADSCRQRMRSLSAHWQLHWAQPTIVINSISGAYLAFYKCKFAEI